MPGLLSKLALAAMVVATANGKNLRIKAGECPEMLDQEGCCVNANCSA